MELNELKENYIDKYYEHGDRLIKVLNLIDSDDGILFIYIRYSGSHDYFNINAMTLGEFDNYFARNEIEYGADLMPEIKAYQIIQ